MTHLFHPVRRVGLILDLLADDPGHAFTLTELAPRLGFSHTACHAWLTELTRSGYLYRTHEEKYLLGPTLIAIARSAREPLQLQIAQSEMRALAKDFGAICSAIDREGDECIIRSRLASSSHFGRSSPQGTRMLLRAPFAATYYAWSPQTDTDAWLERVAPVPTTGERRELSETMRFARVHGYCFYTYNASAAEPQTPAELAFSRSRREFPVAMSSELDETQGYRLTSIVAPIFDSSRRVILVLGLMGFAGSVAGSRIEKMGRSLRAACDRITASLATLDFDLRETGRA